MLLCCAGAAPEREGTRMDGGQHLGRRLGGEMDMVLSYSHMIKTTAVSLAGNPAVCMVALSCLVLGCAAAAFVKSADRWKVFPPELILPIIVGLTLLLLNTIWGTPFGKPDASSTASGMRAALAGVAGYLIYIVSSVTIWYNLWGSMRQLRMFTISLTFALLHVMVKPSEVVAALATLTMAVVALFFLAVLSCLLLEVIEIWIKILLPSAMENCPWRLVFATIIGLTFKLVETMLEHSIFPGIKPRLLDIAYVISHYHVVYLVTRYLTAIRVLWLIWQSPCTASASERMKEVAFLVALGVVMLGMPPTAALASHDLVHRTITTYVTHTLLILGTVIGFMMSYVRDQWPIWMNTLAEKSNEKIKELRERAGWVGRLFLR